MEKQYIKQPYCENCPYFKLFEYSVNGTKKVICVSSAKCRKIYDYLEEQEKELAELEKELLT